MCQSVSHSIATHMFEYFVRPHVCLSVSTSKHRKNLLVWMGHSISCLVLGLLFFFFLGGGGGGYIEFLGDYFLLRGFFWLIFFSVLWWRFINICLTFTPSFTQFFSCTVGKCKCWTVFFFVFGHRQTAE